MRKSSRSLGIALGASLLVAVPLLAHTALTSSSPEEDAVLSEAPEELRLTYNERIDPKLATVRLTGIDGTQIALDSLVQGASEREIVAGITGSVPNSVYTVEWQVLGADGHPVRGDFSFTVAAADPDTAAQLPPALLTDPEQAAPLPADEPLSVLAPSYVAVRWLTFAALMVAIGAVAFRFIVLRHLERARAPSTDAVIAPAAAGAAVIGRGALLFLLLAAGARLGAQHEALGPLIGTGTESLQLMLFGTGWGRAWMLQVAAAALGALAFHAAARGSRPAWAGALAAALALAVTPALSGHAAAVSTLAPLAIASDTVHVLAVSAWLGTLLFVVGVGLPVAFRTGSADAPAAVAALVAIFSPAALICAGIAAATGVASAAFHLPSVSALWLSEYGRMLLLKLAIVLLVIGAGAYNWRRVRPRLAAVEGAPRLRRSAAVELLAAAVVLLVTAILVATPTP